MKRLVQSPLIQKYKGVLVIINNQRSENLFNEALKFREWIY